MSNFQNILVAIESGLPDQPVLECAAQLAEANHAALKIVDVVPEFSWPQRWLLGESEHIHKLLIREKSEAVKSVTANLRRRGLDATGKVLVGQSSVEIIRQVLRNKHDLVMKDAKGSRSRRLGFFGTTGIELLRKCPCAVWLFKPSHAGVFHRVLAAVNTDPDDPQELALSDLILQMAKGLCISQKAELDVLHVWSIYGEHVVQDYLKTIEFRELEQSLRESHGQCLEQAMARCDLAETKHRVHMLRGEPTTEIPAFVRARQSDLLVMGTIGRRALAGLLMGHTAEIIFNQVQCSVLALKPAQFVCPVKVRSRKPAARPSATNPIH